MDIARLGMQVDSRPVTQATADVHEFARAGKRASDEVGAFGDKSKAGFQKAANEANKAGSVFSRVGAILAGIGVGVALRNIGRMADTWTDLQSRVGLAVGDMDQAATVMGRLSDMARRTYSSIDLTAEGFLQNANALRDLGLSTSQALDFTESMNNAMVVSGAKAEQATRVQMALSNAMGLGKLQGDQLNTVLMAGGRVAELLAEELDTTTLGLRKMAADGKITSDVIVRTLLGSLEKLREEADSMPATIGDAFVLIGNSALQLVGRLDQVTGVSSRIADVLITLADNLDRVAIYAATAAALIGGRYVVAAVAARLATLTLAGSLAFLRAALIRTGIGIAVVAAGELVYQFTRLVKGAGSVSEALNLLGDVGREIWSRMPLAVSAATSRIEQAFLLMRANVLESLAGLVDRAAAAGPAIVSVFEWATTSIGTLFGNLPGLIGSGIVSAVNFVIGKVEELVQKTVTSINRLIEQVNRIPGVTIQTMDAAGVSVGRVANEFEGMAETVSRLSLESVSEGLRGAAAEARDAASGAGFAAEAMTELAGAPLGSIESLRKVLAGAADEADGGASAADGLGTALAGAGAAGEEAGKKGAKGTREASRAAKEAKEIAEERLRLERELLELQGNTSALRRLDLEALDPTNHALQEMIWNLEDAKERMQGMEGAVDGVSGAFGDFVARGLRDFKGFTSDILASFQRMISQMVATAARNRIMIGLGLGGTGTAAMAAQPGGVMSGVAGIGGAFSGGLSSVASGLMGGGLSGGIGAIGTALSGATSGLAGLATAAGALALPVAGVVAAFSFFRSKTKELDRGLRITAEGAGALVEEFQRVEKSRFWGLSKSRRTNLSEADEDVSAPIKSAYRDIHSSVSGMADSLGLGASALRGFTYSLQVSLKGLSEDQAQQEITKQFGLMSDAMARAAMGTGRYIRDNETATQAIERMSSALMVANGMMETLGGRLFDISLGGANAASGFIDRLGGIEAALQASEFYFQNFYSLSERASEAQRQFNRAFAKIPSHLAKTVPQTEKSFRLLMDRMMRHGHMASAGELLKLAPLFTELQRLQGELDATGQAAGETADVLAERERLQRRIYELEGRRLPIWQMEAAALDKSNRELYWRTIGLQKEQEALQKAAEIADERNGLERRLLELQGNTAEIRRRELEALDPANRALQRMIWGLEDAKKAMDALDPRDFATLVDFRRAQGAAVRGEPANSGAAPVYQPTQTAPVVTDHATVVELRKLRIEVADMREEQRQLGMRIQSNTKRTSDTLRGFDVAGMPAVRAG